MDADRTLDEILNIMQEADAESARGARLHKAGDKVNKGSLAEHHDRMADFYAAMADRHAVISDAYATGKGVVRKAEGATEDEDDGDTGTDLGKGRQAYGAQEALRSRASKRDKPVTRANLVEMMEENNKNLIKTMVEIFRPPTDSEVDADTQAHVDALVSKGYNVEDPSLSQRSVHKMAVVRDGAADAGKVEGAAPVDTVADDTKLALLRKRAQGEGDDAILARTELEQLSKAAIRKTLREPRNATSGQMAGFRGR